MGKGLVGRLGMLTNLGKEASAQESNLSDRLTNDHKKSEFFDPPLSRVLMVVNSDVKQAALRQEREKSARRSLRRSAKPSKYNMYTKGKTKLP